METICFEKVHNLCGIVYHLEDILILKKPLLFTVFVKWDGQTQLWIYVHEFTVIQRAI